jgi:hypothetical protein
LHGPNDEFLFVGGLLVVVLIHDLPDGAVGDIVGVLALGIGVVALQVEVAAVLVGVVGGGVFGAGYLPHVVGEGYPFEKRVCFSFL